MADHGKKASKIGHCGPLRSVYALRLAARRDVRFSLRGWKNVRFLQPTRKPYQMLAVDGVST
jgi:hypothetical protein